MKINDKLLINHGDDNVMELIYMGWNQTQYLFSKPDNIVHFPEKAVLWATYDMGTTEFISIKKEHNFIQLSENTWELNIEPIEMNDL